jgi:signal transduction histidine kinase
MLLGISDPAEAGNIRIPDGSGESRLKDVRPGRKILVKHTRNGEAVQLSIRSQRIKISGQNNTLLSVQNIRQELEQHEVESWQRLIRVFIHEILNSVSPITLTATGTIALVESSAFLDNKSSEYGAIINALQAIRKRSKGISSFMESYRQLTRIPSPELNEVDVGKMAENIGQLMYQDFQQRKISFIIRLSQREIKLWCDEKLVEQALINLLRNACDALHDTSDPVIKLSCVSLQDRIEIIIQDNGPGIDPGVVENIFVPFFTTKAEGTGIGLSLSRQIVNLHGGRIAVHSQPGETFFTLSFPLISR